jgi:hypothetical protein
MNKNCGDLIAFFSFLLMLQLILVYFLGGFTCLPLLCFIYICFFPKNLYKTKEKHNNTREEEPTTNYSVKEGWVQLTEEYEARKTSEPTDSNSLFYAVLKHGTLFCYESDSLTNVCKILPIQDYTVSLYPEDKTEQQLFSRLSAIKLSHPNKTLYLNCHRKIDKEDWYLGLLEAHCMLQDSPDKAQYDMIDSLHFDPCAIEQLIFRVQSTPSQRETSWMNAILGRIFLSVYKAETFKDYVKTKIAKKINNKRPSFLEEISVRKVDVGPSLPSITNPALKSISKDGEVIAEATVDYLGGLTVEIETDLNWSYSSRLKPIRMNLVLAVTLKRLAGRLVFMIKAPPTDRYWLAFDEMPEMEWKITPVVADKQITLSIVTNAIESRIREVMAETFVLPNMDDTPFFKRDDGIIRDLSSKLDEKVLGEAFSAKTEIVHQTLLTKHVSQPHENLNDRSNSFLRKRHKINEDAESTKSNYSSNSVSSNSSSGSSFLRKLTNYLPSESPTSIRRHTLIHKAEEFINKRTTENTQTSIEARRTSREEEKYETSLLQPTPLSVQPRSRASSFINDISSIPVSMTNKPPLPPRRNSTPIPFQKDETIERSATAPAIPNKPRPVITQRKPPLPSRPNNNTSENSLSS